MKKTVVIIIFSIFCFGIYIQAKEIKRPDSYAYTRGLESLQNEKFQDALDWFNREIADRPDNGYAYYYISRLRYRNEEYGKALSAIDQALKLIPKKDKVWRSAAFSSRAHVNIALSDTVQALNDLTSAIKIMPEDKDNWKERGDLYYEQEKYDLSDADFRKMIELDTGDVVGYMGIGRNALAMEQWADAISQFDYVIKLSPEYSSGYSFRAEALLGQKKWNEATDDIIKALDIDGDNKAFYLMKYLPSEAYTFLKSKLKIQMAKQPTNRYWPYCLGVVSYTQKEFDDAISYYKQAHSLDASSVFLEQIAKCYQAKKDYTKALDYVEQAYDMNPDDIDLVDLKADLLSKLGRLDECLIERDKYVAHYPEYIFGYLERAPDLMNAHKFNEAIEDYNTFNILVPIIDDMPSLLWRRGDAYRLTGNLEQAKIDYNRVITLEKDSVLSDNSWTPFAYSGLGNHDKAIDIMQEIIKNNKDNREEILYKMACIYARAGKNSDAINYLSIVINEGYKEIGILKTDYNLDNIRDLPEFQRLLSKIEDEDISKDENTDSTKEEQYETVEISFTKDGGVTKVQCNINGLPLHFVFDTGAADVTISMVEANFMLKNDYIKPNDIVGAARYMDANGDISEGTVINIRQVNFGGLELDNVRASVVRNQRAPLLLGQSVLGRLGKIEIDNERRQLKITHKMSSDSAQK